MIIHSKSSDNLENYVDQRIVTVKQLSEGFNKSNIQRIILAQYNSTELDFIQRMSRANRLDKNKNISEIYILYTVGTQEEVWFKKITENFNYETIKL